MKNDAATTPPAENLSETLLRLYGLMHAYFGPTHWWPGDTPFEIAIGAILTQNTAWANVEKAIVNLKRAGLLRPRPLLAATPEFLETAIRPSGYYRQKTERVRAFSAYLLSRHGGSMKQMAKQDTETLRRELLAIKGIGPETADDILLYACDKPVFVVDAYTRRILARHGIVDERLPYEAFRQMFEHSLPGECSLYREYHGLLVFTGKEFCRSKPRCDGCPLESALPAPPGKNRRNEAR